MRNLVDAVLVNIDAAGMQQLISLKAEAETILDEIRTDLDAVRPEISFWDRINVFRLSESELLERDYRRELLDEKRNLAGIRADIHEKVLSAINRTYSAKLKLHLSELLTQAEALRGVHGPKGQRKKVKGKKEMILKIELIDEELSDRFGFDPGPVMEAHLVQAIIGRLGV